MSGAIRCKSDDLHTRQGGATPQRARTSGDAGASAPIVPAVRSARLLPCDGLLGWSSFFFCGGKGLDPLVLCKPPLPLS
jgi:hypothetical protein